MWKRLFRRKGRRRIEQWEMDLLKNTLQKLPCQYHYLLEQIDANLLETVLSGLGDLPHWKTFGYNSKIVDRYDKPDEASYLLVNIQVFDKKSGKYLEYTIGCTSGTLAGYSINCDNEFDIDVVNIDTRYFKKKMIVSNDYFRIEKLLTFEERKLIIPSNVYEVKLEQKTFYHLVDLENGDFIAIDLRKNVYCITHDPYEIKLLNSSLEEILITDSCSRKIDC